MFSIGADTRIAEWHVLGPFPNAEPAAPVPGGDYREGFYRDWLVSLGGEANATIVPGSAVTYAGPDGEERTVAAARAAIGENGVVDLAEALPGREPAVIYAACTITAEREERIFGYLATTGSARVWIDGKEVYSRYFAHGRSLQTERDFFTARVKPGENRLLVKLERTSPSWFLGLDLTDAAGRLADERYRAFELQAFQEVKVEPAGERWLIEPGPFPEIGWADADLVAAIMGPIPLAAHWYRVRWSADGESATFDKVSAATGPGTYLAVAEGRTQDGARVARGLTFACVPAGWAPPVEAVERYVAGLPLMSRKRGPNFLRSPHTVEFLREIVETLAPLSEKSGTQEQAILLSAFERARLLDRPLRRIDDPLVVDGDLHAMLRFRREGTGEPRLLAPPRSIAPPAPVLRHGTPEEAGMKPETVARLDELGERWASTGGEPHADLVARHGVIFYDRAFGGTTSDAPMWVASITKMLSTLLYARYVDQGLMDWDDPVGKYLPDFSTSGPEVLRIRNLLDHTSGLFGHAMWNGIYNPYLDDIIANGAAYLHPGARHNYGGMGYDLAGFVIEAISGRGVLRLAYEDWLDELDVPDLTMGDFGGLAFASAHDLAKIGQVLRNHGSYDGKEFFRPETLDRMMPAPLSPRYPSLPEGIEWGMGLVWMRQGRPDAGTGDVPAGATFLSPNTIGHGAASAAIFRVDLDNDIVVIQTRNNGGNEYSEHAEQFFRIIDEGILPGD